MEGRYIYGIIKESRQKSFGSCGINADEETYALPYQDIACVISKTPALDYSSMLKEDLGRFLVKHQRVIEKIMKDYTIIPMKFGTNVSGDDEVIEMLKEGYSRFNELLEVMDGKIELNVACIWNDLTGIIKEIGEQNNDIRMFKAEISKKPPSETLQDKIKIGMMIKGVLDTRRKQEEKRIVDFLKGFSEDFQIHQVMDDRMILNCAFLLEKKRERDFDAALKKLDSEYGQLVNFRCIGPLPPYSFATCCLKKVEHSQINDAKELLGLGERISLEEIKEAYRQLAQKKHPDKDFHNTGHKNEFENITNAYKLLSGCCRGSGCLTDENKKNGLMLVEILRP